MKSGLRQPATRIPGTAHQWPRHRLWALALGVFATLAQSPVPVPTGTGPMEGVGITEKLGDPLPLESIFSDEKGNPVRLGDFFKAGRPVVLNLVYYNCPGVCLAELNGLVEVLRQTAWRPGEEFVVVTVSFDPRETPPLAAAKKENYIRLLDRPEAASGWSFLTGQADSIGPLTQSCGFSYRWIEDRAQFAHDAALIVATPDGRISRYLRGLEYDPQTLRLSMVEASGGKIGTFSDRIWLGLCGYDARYGRYVILAQQVMKIGGLITIFVVAGLVVFLHGRDRRRRRKAMGDVQPEVA